MPRGSSSTSQVGLVGAHGDELFFAHHCGFLLRDQVDAMTWLDLESDLTDLFEVLQVPQYTGYRVFDPFNKGTRDPIKKRASAKAWLKRNPGKQNAYNRAWRERNPEKHRALKRGYYARNREQCLANTRAWRERNRERRNARARELRALKKGKTR